jgi:hypothetical protein
MQIQAEFINMEEYTKEETLDIINEGSGIFPVAVNGDIVNQHGHWFIMKNNQWEHHQIKEEE